MGADDPEVSHPGMEVSDVAAIPPQTAPHNDTKELVKEEGYNEEAQDGSDDASSDDLEKPLKEKQPIVYPMREFSFSLPTFLGADNQVTFNWFVSLFSLAFLWGMAIFCMMDPSEAKMQLDEWYAVTEKYFTWFYILGNPVMTFFIFWVAYRFGSIKLGPKNGEPKFSDISYFAMLFSAGVGVGLFFYGVSEPLYHQTSNYYTNAGYHSQNEIDMWALEITMYHWGFAGWSPYLMIAISVGLGSYCFDLPFTMRSCFYFILGNYIFGWIGDLIDGWGFIMTVFGVCTSLGLGKMQIVAGMQRLNWIDPANEDLQTVYVIVIWVITAFATLSVVSGLKVGIKMLSLLGFILGCLILFLCFVMEKSYFLMNLVVQTTGYYFQWSIFQVPFWTDAFGALDPGEGRATDSFSAESWWIGAWTVFYMAWWVSWACFVGLFIGCISKNRSILNVVLGVFIAPTMYALLWFTWMGGIGLRQQRQALELKQLGQGLYGDEFYYQIDSSMFCYDVPQQDVYNETDGSVAFHNTLLGITPVCEFNSKDATSAWFNVMYSFSYPGTGTNGDFGGFGQFMSGLSLLALAIYFITSSDSGSLVVDTLTSNGAEDHHWLQRVFWAVTEGAVATGLLVAGGSDALGALQAAAIVFGLPFNFFCFVLCWSIYTMCRTLEKYGHGDKLNGSLDPSKLLPRRTWSMPLYSGIFNIFEFLCSFGQIHKARKEYGMDVPAKAQVV